MLPAANKAMVPGAQGVYLFGAHRIWFQRPGRDNSGVSGFYQFGTNNTNALPARQYFGAGLTGFGLVPGRPDDSLGFGLALTWLNTTPDSAQFFHLSNTPATLRSSQLMLAWYYQWKIRDGCFFQPTLTYIPTPGEGSSIPAALTANFRLIVLF
jgi:porin